MNQEWIKEMVAREQAADIAKRSVEAEQGERTPASGSGGVGGMSPVSNECYSPVAYQEASRVPMTPLSTVGRGEYRVTQAEQAAKSASHHRQMVAHHQEKADAHEDASHFFQAHPEFEVFLNLIRRGGISI